MAWAESPGSHRGFDLPGLRRLWVEGGTCSCRCRQLHSSAHALLAGPRQVIPQPPGALCAAGCCWGFLVCGCGHLWCRGVAWSCCSGDVISPHCLYVWSGNVPTSGGAIPVSAASATGSSGLHECALESSRSEWCRRRSSRGGGGGGFRSGEKRRRGRSPSPTCSSRSACASASSLDAGKQEAAMPPPSSVRSGVGGSRLGSDRLAPCHDSSPQLGPSGLGSGLRSSPGSAWGLLVILPQLLRVLRKTTMLVLPIRSTWIGMTPFGLFFISSGNFIAWRNRQV